MDRVAHLLFKYKWPVFSKGQFQFDTQPSYLLITVGTLAIGIYCYFLFFRSGTRPSRPARVALAALRATLMLLLLILLMRPVVIVESVIPLSSWVAILADDSRSMSLADANGRRRLDGVKDLLATNSAFMGRLGDKFRINLYSFSSSATKLQDANKLRAEGSTTDLAGGLQTVIKSSTSAPLSAIVVVSDGASNAQGDIVAQLKEVRSRGVPVFTVGVGGSNDFADAELVRVTLPRRVLIGSDVNAEALVRLSGYGQTKITINVSEDGRAIKTQDFQLRGNAAEKLTIELTPTTAGTHRYSFEIAPLKGELTTENNKQEALVQVVDKQVRVLYIEGEPRWEYGKLRAALSRKEEKVVLVSVLRSAEGKFYRQGVENEQELASGFPQTEEELFSYQGLILGSIEANFFTYDQLKNIEQFVSRRGGGFLAVGGRYAFGAGKYANTPVGDLLPLYLSDSPDFGHGSEAADRKAVLTERGRTHPVTRLSDNPALSLKAWEDLPPITVPEILSRAKPGATVLLEATSVRSGNHSRAPATTVPLLAEERYGRGRTLALTANDTWRWRMQTDSSNESHETFWRRLLRYLVSTTPDRIEVTTAPEACEAGETVRMRVEVNDRGYHPVADARVTLRVTKPSGNTVDVPLRFGAGEKGPGYRGEYITDEQGLYRIDASAAGRDEMAPYSAESSFLVTELNREFYDSAQNVDLLKMVAAETGGKYYPIGQALDLLEDLTYREGPNSERVKMELWDMPINFLVILSLALGEWFMRKRKGLA